MLSVTTIGTTDGEAVLFIHSDAPSLDSVMRQLPLWVWSCDDAEVDVFVRLGDRVLHCPIAQFLQLADE